MASRPCLLDNGDPLIAIFHPSKYHNNITADMAEGGVGQPNFVALVATSDRTAVRRFERLGNRRVAGGSRHSYRCAGCHTAKDATQQGPMCTISIEYGNAQVWASGGDAHNPNKHHDDCVTQTWGGQVAHKVARAMSNAAVTNQLADISRIRRDAQASLISVVRTDAAAQQAPNAYIESSVEFDRLVRRKQTLHKRRRSVMPVIDVVWECPQIAFEEAAGVDERPPIRIFCVRSALRMMQHSDVWLCDGTFDVAPAGYKQLYTVAAYHSKGECLPVFWGWLPDKTELTYTTFFGAVRAELEQHAGIFPPPGQGMVAKPRKAAHVQRDAEMLAAGQTVELQLPAPGAPLAVYTADQRVTLLTYLRRMAHLLGAFN